MLEGIWYGIIAAFVFIGVLSTAYIIMQILKTDARGRYVVIIPAKVSDEDIGTILYGAHMRMSLLGDCCYGKIVILDMGMSDKQIELCDTIMKECGNMELCKPYEVLPLLTGKEK